MKHLWKLLAASLLPATAWADTIAVDQARFIQPIEVRAPYTTTSKNMKGEAYDIKQLIAANGRLADQAAHSTVFIRKGAALLPDTTFEGQALAAMQFTVSSDRFTKAQLQIKKLKDYKIFVNGKETGSGELRLTGGTVEVALLCLTSKVQKDSFDVALTGDHLEHLKINAPGKKAYTLDEMIYGEHYYGVALSPSGKYLISSSYNLKEGGQADYRTVVTEIATQRTVFRQPNYISLNWMPCRDVFYYTRNGAKGKELVTFDPATQEEEVLATSLPDGGFSMAPTEDYLIYSSTQEGKYESGPLKRLHQPDDRMPGWRNRNYLSRYDLKTGIMQQLTFGKESVYLNDISADGKQLLLSTGHMDTRREPFSTTTLLSMNVADNTVDTLLQDEPYIAGAKFSPDARQLVVTASPAAFKGIGCEVKEGQIPNMFDYRLYLYDLSTRKAQPLLRHFNAAVGNVQWSHADNRIYFKATDECNETLYSVDPEKGEIVRYALPVSYIQGYSIAMGTKHPRAVFYGQTGERAREMYTCQLNRQQPKAERIGHINFDEMYKDVAIGTCHDWSFRTSRGDTVKGHYFLPADFDANKKYPLLVYYYGGCTPTPKMLEFHYPLQVLAAMGYVVYVCEPSGAIGYGQEFAARHVNTWGEMSGDDIIEGTKTFIKEHPFIKADKVGCMGASYGGFMTQYLQTRTDIFAAAISHAGISNIASYWGGGYWGYTYGQIAQYGSYPWNNLELYTRHSPLFNADKVKTPLLLLHGTADTNVPTNESQQMFTALRILGRPVSYIQVDGENHVIVDHNKRLKWQEAIFAWFAYWLKDQPEWWKELYPEDHFGQDETAQPASADNR